MTEHDIVFDGMSPHNGEHWYKCTECKKSDWIASYGVLSQLNFFYLPCNSKKKELKMETKIQHMVKKFAADLAHNTGIDMREFEPFIKEAEQFAKDIANECVLAAKYPDSDLKYGDTYLDGVNASFESIRQGMGL